MWSIKSSAPTTAKVVIGRIEPWADKTVVHISVIDVPVPSCLHVAAKTTTIGHMPFEKSALSASLDKLLSMHASPDPAFEDGYKQWQAAKGGIFTIDESGLWASSSPASERSAPWE